MAAGNKNYFRHSFIAHRDEKIVQLIDQFGMAGYAYFFIILELCGEQWDENCPEKFVFHQRVLLNSLLVRQDKLRSYLAVTSQLLLIHATTNGTKIELRIPNFKKYIGKYSKQLLPDGRNKRKEKKRKEKESKTKEQTLKIVKTTHNKFNFDTIYQEYPKKVGKKIGMERCKKYITTQDQYSNLQSAVKNYTKHCSLEGLDSKYIKHFSSFMNSWEDWIILEDTQVDDPVTIFFKENGMKEIHDVNECNPEEREALPNYLKEVLDD